MSETYLHLAIEQCATLLNCDDAMLYVWDESRQRLIARAATDRHRDFELAIELALGDGVVGWSALNREPVVLSDLPAEDLRFRLVPDVDEAGHRSFIAVPLHDSTNQVQAVIVARHMDPDRFDEADVSVLQSIGALILHHLLAGRLALSQINQDRDVESIRAIGEAGASDALQAHEAVNLIANQLAETTQSDIVLIVSAQISNRPYLEARGLGVRRQAELPPIQVAQVSAAAVAAATGSGRSLHQDEAPELFAAIGARSIQSMHSVLAIPMRTRGLSFGTVLAYQRSQPPRRSDSFDQLQRLVSQAALAIAVIDLTTDPDERRAERRLLEILFGGDDRMALMNRLADEVGFDLGAAHCVAYGRLGSDTPALGAQLQMQTLERVIRQAAPGSLCDVQMHGVRAVIPLLHRTAEELAALLRTGLALRPGLALGYIGVSDPVGPISRYRVALQEASLAARLCTKQLPSRPTLAFSQTGAERFLLPLIDAGEAGLLEQQLRELYDQDMKNGTDLFVTVECFLELGCRPTATSRKLNLHRNSLAARLRSASRILGGITIDNENRLMLEVGTKLVRLRLAD